MHINASRLTVFSITTMQNVRSTLSTCSGRWLRTPAKARCSRGGMITEGCSITSTSCGEKNQSLVYEPLSWFLRGREGKACFQWPASLADFGLAARPFHKFVSAYWCAAGCLWKDMVFRNPEQGKRNQIICNTRRINQMAEERNIIITENFPFKFRKNTVICLGGEPRFDYWIANESSRLEKDLKDRGYVFWNIRTMIDSIPPAVWDYYIPGEAPWMPRSEADESDMWMSRKWY